MLAGCGRRKRGTCYATDKKHGRVSSGGLHSLFGIRWRGRLPHVVGESQPFRRLLWLCDLPINFCRLRKFGGTGPSYARLFGERPARPNRSSKRAETRSAAPFKFSAEGGRWGPVMRNLLLYVLMLFMFAASVASATTMLSRPSSSGDDFCFGYAICE